MDLELKIDILIDCHEDDVGLWFLIGIIYDNLNPSDQELKKTTLDIALELLKEGLIQAGDPLPNGTFKQKKGTPKNIIKYIEREWDALGREPNIFDIISFYITEKGKKELMELLMRFFQEHRKLQVD